MALRISSLIIIISSIKLSQESLVLADPPSSPNEIKEIKSIDLINGKIIEDKKFYNKKLPTIYYQNRNYDWREGNGGFDSSTNVEKPNTDGYKLLEIEFSGKAEETGANFNFDDILREVFKNEGSTSASTKEEEKEEKEEEEEEKMIRNNIEMKNKNNKKKNSINYADKYYYLKLKNRPIISNNIKTIITNKNKTHDKLTVKIINDKPLKYIKEILLNDDDKNKDKKIINNERKNQIIRLINDYSNYHNYPRDNYATAEFHTTENSLPTSSELPKQIPPPPSRVPSIKIVTHTTPVLKLMSRRTDILPSY